MPFQDESPESVLKGGGRTHVTRCGEIVYREARPRLIDISKLRTLFEKLNKSRAR